MDQDTWIGRQLGSYKIVRLLGKGGSGRVYKAQHVLLEREAAVKIMRADSDRVDGPYTALLEEARTIAQMRHPHIVQLYDFGQLPDTYYMVMEYIQGESLDARLSAAQASGRLLPGVEVWRVIKQMGEALTYIHERGVIHRDIKPANILLTKEGNVVISDFGIAKLLAGYGDTTSGVILGTPTYMSPEQAMGQPIDHRADLYSMAVMVYEMLAGRVPFKGASPLAVILKHLNDSAPPPRQFNPSIPPHVETELLRVLSKRPENRHQSVAEFVLALASAGRTIYASPLSGVADQIRTLIGPDGKEYVQVPAGEFQMGGAENDSPTRRVYVDGFYISRHPVTNAEYHAFAEATGYRRPEYWKDGIYPDWQADHPVTYVNWHDAAAYCRWVGGRLPTEAEWEKAARGTDGRRYPWGGAFDTTRCNSREGAKEGTSTVGRYSPSGDSPYGVSDMAGNVWEWVLDWWVALESDTSLQQNPMGPAAGKTKVIRGGSYLNAESLVACHARDHARPEVGAVNYGFRVRMGEGMFTTSTGRTGKLWKIKRADT